MFEIAGKGNPRCYVAKPKLKDKFGMERMRNAMKVHPYPHAILPTPLRSPSSKETLTVISLLSCLTQVSVVCSDYRHSCPSTIACQPITSSFLLILLASLSNDGYHSLGHQPNQEILWRYQWSWTSKAGCGTPKLSIRIRRKENIRVHRWNG